MDYDLFRLNSRSFEQLIQAIAAQVLGQGLIPFGDGPDGGREGAITSRVPYPSEVDKWDGRIVLQAKFRQRTQGNSADGRWAVDQLRQELEGYGEDSPRKAPDYLIFATNVTLSAVEGSGAKDRVFALANEVIARDNEARQQGAQEGLRGFDVWDYDKLRMYLDQFEEVRRSFGAYILPGDVLAETVATLEEIRTAHPGFDDSISRFLQKELLAEQWVNLDQAGTTSEEQVPVSRVFVDLPVFPERQADPPEESADDLTPGFAAHVVEIASRRHDQRARDAERPGGAGTEPGDGRLALLGGPGQGKSTIGQFICQMFRVALLRSRPQDSLSQEVLPVLSMVESHCRDDRLSLPSARRFPLRVVLSDFAEDLAKPDGAGSLLEYLAGLVSDRIPGEVPASLMLTWMSEYPWLLVLDGLDEVPASSSREDVMKAIADFWVDMSQSDADCLVIATTRPQGYGEEFSPRFYRHTWLAPISTARALHYADRLLTARFPHDTDRQERIAGRLEDATSRPETARLMTSPLQVTIMAALLDRMGKPPPGRWSLFSQYYRVIYERESERDIPAASVLRNYKRDVDAIHQRVGLLLQVEGETTEQEVRMPRKRFSEVVVARLEGEGHDPDAARELGDRIIEAAMHRLVFLVGLQADQVGFELRSLQEFMAAEALLDAKEAVIEKRLRTIAPLPSWRNVFLFGAGRCFSDLEQYRDTIHTICVELDDAEAERLAPVAMSGATLAIDLLADGVAERRPRYERLLGREALRIVRRPPSGLHDQLAEVYTPALHTTYEEELKTALASTPFVATLGAWRTLAVMGARSVDWVRPLLERHLPAPGDLGALLQALPSRARSRWLAEMLAALCTAAPPEQSLPHAERLRELNVFKFTPFWYRALVDPGREFRRSELDLAIKGQGSSGVSVTLLGVDRNGRWLGAATDRIAQTTAPAHWLPLFSVLRFSASPSVATLSETLDVLLDVEDFGAVRRSASAATWPLAGLLRAASNRGELEALAELARGEQLGDLTKWKDAERRWHHGVGGEDLAYPPDGTLPYDAAIGLRGFPFATCTRISPQGPEWSAAKDMLAWLAAITHPASRRVAARVLFGMLEPSLDEAKRAPISARDVAAVLGDEDLADCTALRLGALSNLLWEPSGGDGELRLVNALGERFRRVLSWRLSPQLCGLLASAWTEHPELDGLYRVLAIGWPRHGMDRRLGERLLERVPGERTRAAHTLLRLKLADPDLLQEVPLAPLVEAEEVWVTGAAQLLEQLDRSEAVEAVTAQLDGRLPASRWLQKSALDSIARGLIRRRSSRLASREQWDSLELFERPWH